MKQPIISEEYTNLLADLKTKVASARQRVALSVNKELVLLYYEIGSAILKAQKTHGWGAKVIQQISKDLRSEFPSLKGFSPQNLKYMRRFSEEYQADEIGQQLVDQLPWGHIVTLVYNISVKCSQTFNNCVKIRFWRFHYEQTAVFRQQKI